VDRVRAIRASGDGLLALALSVLYPLDLLVFEPGGPGNASGDPAPANPTAAIVAGVAFTASLAWRRRIPLLPVALAIVAAIAASPRPVDASLVFLVAVAAATYTVGAESRGQLAPVGAVTVLSLAAVLAVQEPDWAEEFADPILAIAIVVGPYLVGLAMRARHDREVALERRHEMLEQDRVAREAAAITAERARIARELHDVVAHAVSVIVVQARGGRRALADDPGAAREAFDAIEQQGSAAMTEMRRLLGMLRDTDESAERAPQPGLRNVDDLARQMTEAGLPVEVVVEGTPGELPPGIDLSAYRVVQEALTNALRHAGPVTAQVVLRYGDDDVEVEVIDSGPGPASAARPRPGTENGHGLAGMRERVSLFGGQLVTETQAGGGFAVRATFPREAAGP
jgi:signal transduction histidine kinase